MTFFNEAEMVFDTFHTQQILRDLILLKNHWEMEVRWQQCFEINDQSVLMEDIRVRHASRPTQTWNNKCACLLQAWHLALFLWARACKSISFWIAHSKVNGRHLQSVRPFLSGRPHGWSLEKHAALRLQSGTGRGVCTGTRLECWVSAQPKGGSRMKAPHLSPAVKHLSRNISPTKGPDEIRLQPKHRVQTCLLQPADEQLIERRTLSILCFVNECDRLRLWAKMVISTTMKDLGDCFQCIHYDWSWSNR